MIGKRGICASCMSRRAIDALASHVPAAPGRSELQKSFTTSGYRRLLQHAQRFSRFMLHTWCTRLQGAGSPETCAFGPPRPLFAARILTQTKRLRCSSQMEASSTSVRGSTGAAEQRKLGASGIQVPACCLGTMTWGSQNTEAEAHEQLSYALDRGLNFIDTAEVYPVPPKAETGGLTDKYVGSWLKGVQRDKITLATKVAGYGNKWLRSGDQVTRVSPDQIRASVDGSLQRLQTDYIDLLQIHWPDRHVGLFGRDYYDPANARWEDDVSFEEQLEGLAAVVESGKVRAIGVSNETSYGVMRFLEAARAHGLPRITSIQNNYSLLVRVHFDVNLAEVTHERNGDVALLAYSPLAGGSLSGKYVDGSASSKSRFNLFEGYMARYNKSPARQAVSEYVAIAERYGMTPAELAIAWCNQRWTVTSTIIGATSMQQLKENIGAFDIRLPEEALKEIEAVHAIYRDPSNRPVDE